MPSKTRHDSKAHKIKLHCTGAKTGRTRLKNLPDKIIYANSAPTVPIIVEKATKVLALFPKYFSV